MTETPQIPAMFKIHPELGHRLPRITLGNFPTPVRPIDHLGIAGLWVKRDDLSSNVYGGNKVRKLEFALAQVKQQRKTHVMTLGGIGTNHGLATAIYCRRLALACTLILFPQPVTSVVKQNLRLFCYHGARLVYRPSLMGAVFTFYLTQRLRHPHAYFLPAGGSNAIGTLGFVNAAYELKAQVDAGEMPAPAVIFCPVGSNGTLAGLTLGARLAGLDCEIIGVRVSFAHCGPFQNCTAAKVRRLMSQTLHVLKQVIPEFGTVDLPEPVLWHDYLGGGYGFPTASGGRAGRLLERREQIRLDPTYTAKTFAAVLDYCRKRAARSGPVLYWHTYNSVDLDKQARSVDENDLPGCLRPFLSDREIEDYTGGKEDDAQADVH